MRKRVQSKRLKAPLLTPAVAARFAGFAAHAADRQRPGAQRAAGGVSRKHRAMLSITSTLCAERTNISKNDLYTKRL